MVNVKLEFIPVHGSLEYKHCEIILRCKRLDDMIKTSNYCDGNCKDCKDCEIDLYGTPLLHYPITEIESASISLKNSIDLLCSQLIYDTEFNIETNKIRKSVEELDHVSFSDMGEELADKYHTARQYYSDIRKLYYYIKQNNHTYDMKQEYDEKHKFVVSTIDEIYSHLKNNNYNGKD